MRNFRKLSLEQLKEKLEKYKGDLSYFNETLKMLPENTFLGRVGMMAEIKHIEKKIAEISQVIAERQGI